VFKKIVSNLSFSPALVGQLAFYAKRLRREQATRRLGLIFVALALVVQSLVMFQAPQSANATTSNDFVAGGLGLGSNRSLNNFLRPYDKNTNNLKDIFTSMGITRKEIAAAKFDSWIVGETYSWGHNKRLSAAQGLTPFTVNNSDGKKVETVWAVKAKYLNGANTRIYGWVGQSKAVGWFAIMQVCGNLVTKSIPKPVPPVPEKCPYNNAILKNDEDCAPCPGNSGLWIKDETCIPEVVQNKETTNLSQGNVDATTVVAQASDRLNFTLTATNSGLAPTDVPLEDDITDVLEYATLTDRGGGTFDEATNTLSWPTITLAPGETQSRTFSVKLLSTIPSTPVGASDPISYDCKMYNTFGSLVTIDVECPPEKVIETVTTELPRTGPAENFIFAGVVLALVAYFYLRSRQIGTEVRLIRRDLNAGTI
jgi:hypothetical protein